MSTFNKLSVLAQYDDVCRLLNLLIDESVEEEQAAAAMLDGFDKLWHKKDSTHVREVDDLRSEVNSLKREIKKLNRQLAESRAALVRETDEKKIVLKEKKALIDHMTQVRLLIESKDGLGNGTNDAQRRRVIKCLNNVEQLSPIQSDESDDCVSGLDYDKTEEDILDPPQTERSRRSNIFDDALEHLPNSNEQPTLLYRYLDKDSQEYQEQPRRRSIRLNAETARQRLSSYNASAPTTTSSSNNYHDKYDLGQNTETDSNGMETTDENDIEYVRQQLKRDEAATASTPNMKAKSATLSARSAANLMKTISNVATPVPNVQKPHSFVKKKSFKPDSCGPCGGKISFYGNVVKCEVCGVISHPECKERCPLPCVKITAPDTRSKSKKILISDYVNNDSVPKVPAIIVHCCNEIERDDNIITEGLYRVVARRSDTEDLQEKILKSKSGMPNLSKVDVHLLTGVVKNFLQGLDESLITTTLWSHFSEAARLDSDVESRTHMTVFISYDLPSANRDTLAYLMQHLHAIAKHSDKNMMTTTNLAKTLAPTIVGNSTIVSKSSNPKHEDLLSENKIQIKIMETLFSIDESFWSTVVQRPPKNSTAATLGSRLLATPTSSSGVKTRSSRMAGTLPTPKVKPLFSR